LGIDSVACDARDLVGNCSGIRRSAAPAAPSPATAGARRKPEIAA